MILKVGQSLASCVDSTTVIVDSTTGIVVRAPKVNVELSCGGVGMVDGRTPQGDGSTIAAGFVGGAMLGKRYVDDALGLEVLCTKPGTGRLEVSGAELMLKAAKPLPSSD